jgi:hypothetical protein
MLLWPEDFASLAQSKITADYADFRDFGLEAEKGKVAIAWQVT